MSYLDVLPQIQNTTADEIAKAVNYPDRERRPEITELMEIGEITLFGLEDSFTQFEAILKKKFLVL
jgi:hypothetical protein